MLNDKIVKRLGRVMLRTVAATRYITPLREGGSLPALVEADDGELYVIKFCGAGQGVKALVAELIAGEIGRTLGLPIPELALIQLEAGFGLNEPHEEIQDLLKASIGLNLGVRFLPSSFAYNPLMEPPPAADFASDIVWFDAYITNVDRTPRNVNMLIWEEQLWLIDHGAALYFHHDWNNYLARSNTPFAFIKQHTLLKYAADLQGANTRLVPRLSESILRKIVEWVPEVWLGGEAQFDTIEEHRAGYVNYLVSRLGASEAFVKEAIHARSALL
jgi:hypothetical protein